MPKKPKKPKKSKKQLRKDFCADCVVELVMKKEGGTIIWSCPKCGEKVRWEVEI